MMTAVPRALSATWGRISRATPFGFDVLFTLGTNLAMAVLSLITGLAVARLLGARGRGELGAIQTWPTAIAWVAMLGQFEAVIYFSAREPRKTGRYLATGVTIALVASPVFMCIAYLLMPLLLYGQNWQVVRAARVYLLLIPMYAMILIPIQALRVGSFVAWNLCRLLPNWGWLLVIVLAAILGKHEAQSVAYGLLVVVACMFIPTAFLISRQVRPPFLPDRNSFGPMLKYGVPSSMGTASQLLNFRLDQMVMAALLAPAAIGLYVVALGWSSALAPALTALSSVILSRVASRTSDQDRIAIFGQCVRIAVLAASVLCVVLLFTTPVAIPLLFGRAFAPAVTCAEILLLGAALGGVNQVLEEGLRGLGEPKAVLISETLGWISMGVGIAVLLPRFYLVGLASGSLLGHSITTLALLVYTSHRTDRSVGTLCCPRAEDFRLLRERLSSVLISAQKRVALDGS